MPICDGAMVTGWNNAYSAPIRARRTSEWSGLVQRPDAAHLVDRALLEMSCRLRPTPGLSSTGRDAVL